MPLVSIITPTKDRQALLPALWGCINAQSVQDFEWLVHDGTSEPTTIFHEIDDQRVSYVHAPEPMTIGAKRNALCAAAKGGIIAHFDDDDYYAPHYLERMISFMIDLNVDFVKLFGFFLYHSTSNTLAYWDLERDFPQHFLLHPNSDRPLMGGKRREGVSARWGYGFSYVFSRRVWEEIKFPGNKDHGEDHIFADKVVAQFKSAGKQDFACSCLHIIHGANAVHTANISTVFPQQILPPEILPKLFPNFHHER
jgi:glycosyltransferase involved in cell wall biosynthesis